MTMQQGEQGNVRPSEINGREVRWIEVRGKGYAIYDEPFYRDKIVIDKESAKVDYKMPEMTGIRSQDRKAVPSIQGIEMVPRELLVLSRALAFWPLGDAITVDSVQDMLSLKVSNALIEAIKANEEWKELLGEEDDDESEGEAQSPTLSEPVS